jgi:hypothetical protein
LALEPVLTKKTLFCRILREIRQMGSASLKLGASFFVSVVILVLVGSWVLYTYESPAEIERCEKAEGAFDSAAILGVDLTEELQEQTSNFNTVRLITIMLSLAVKVAN